MMVQCFAMWELAFISRDYEDRRKGIYEDIERKDGSAWSQISALCLDVIKSVETRIDTYGKAPVPAEAPAPSSSAAEETKFKGGFQPPKEDAIFQAVPTKPNKFRDQVEKVVNQVATAPGQGSQLSPMAKRAIDGAKQGLIEAQVKATGSDDTQGLLKDLALKGLHMKFGWPFRQEYQRRITQAILGSPYGEPSLYINATTALGQLAVASLKEDNFGNVQRDVAGIIRALTSVTSKLEAFKINMPTHWTDVEGKRSCPEVDALLEVLRDQLGDLVTAFGPYARDLRLTLQDVRLAKEAAGLQAPRGELEHVSRHRTQEMRQVR